MKASLEGNGFVYNQETGKWEAPFGVVAKMMGRDVSNIDERDAKYTKLTLGMNFMQRAISAARRIGAEEQGQRRVPHEAHLSGRKRGTRR